MNLAEAGVYLHLLKRTLTRYPLEPSEQAMLSVLSPLDPSLTNMLVWWATTGDVGVEKGHELHLAERLLGLATPEDAETMIGLIRLNNIERCILACLQDGVPGDVVEAGVWRGGACIFARAALLALGAPQRRVWLADSFQGLPDSDVGGYPGRDAFQQDLAVSVRHVKANFARYGLMDDDGVRFLPGWFCDTLPTAPIEQIAVLRLDGDFYSSTMDTLRNLYDRVSPGGYIIMDDYFLTACRDAVNDFRAKRGITAPLWWIDAFGVYWQKGRIDTPGEESA